MKRVPNQKSIYIANNIIKNELKMDKTSIYLAAQNLTSIGGFRIWLYLNTLNKEQKIFLSSKDCTEKMNIGIKAYNTGIAELIDKKYLIQIAGKDNFLFSPVSNIKNIKNEIEIPSNGMSFNEKNIYQLLSENNINFTYNTIVGNFVYHDTQYPPFFDFFVDNKYIIEYDGEQHFKPILIWGGEEGYIKQHKNDLEKNKYCFENNIPLIRIPYDAEYTIDDLKLETTRFLLTLENEQEYYNRS